MGRAPHHLEGYQTAKSNAARPTDHRETFHIFVVMLLLFIPFLSPTANVPLLVTLMRTRTPLCVTNKQWVAWQYSSQLDEITTRVALLPSLKSLSLARFVLQLHLAEQRPVLLLHFRLEVLHQVGWQQCASHVAA